LVAAHIRLVLIGTRTDAFDFSVHTPYGAYWHLSYTHRGKGYTQYIRDAFVPQVKAEVSNFKRFRKLIDRLITLSIERSQLRMKTDKKQ
jgi:hypothetical protein